MSQTAEQVIIAKANEFLAALSTGKVFWTPTDLAAYFLEPKKVEARVTVPEHKLGPIDEARALLVAKVVASLLGATVESSKDGYTFRIPEGAKAGLPQVVEKVVERIIEKPVEVEKKAQGATEVPLVFPQKPVERFADPNYQTPSWYRLLELELNKGKHVSLAGPPGVGKSHAPEQYFIRKGQPLVIVNGDAGFRRRDIEGTTEIQGGSTLFQVAEFAAAAVNGWGCILNEVNAADPDALLFINGVLEEKIINIHGKAYSVHPDFRLVVTYNPGLIGTKPLPQAFKDRFFPIRLDFPNVAFLRRLVCAKTGIPTTTSYLDRLLRYAENCWRLHEKGTLRYQISPRRLFDVVSVMNGYTDDIEIAIKLAVVDAVDSYADRQMLIQLVTSPLADVQTNIFAVNQ